MWKTLFKTLGMLILVSCSAANPSNFIKPTKVWLKKISYTAENDANDKIPIRMDIVFIYDDSAVKIFSEKTSKEYFDDIEKLKADFSGKIEVFSYDILIGRSKNDIALQPKKYAVQAALIFARYTSNTENQRKAIGDQEEIRIVFKNKTFDIIDVKGDSKGDGGGLLDKAKGLIK